MNKIVDHSDVVGVSPVGADLVPLILEAWQLSSIRAAYAPNPESAGYISRNSADYKVCILFKILLQMSMILNPLFVTSWQEFVSKLLTRSIEFSRQSKR